MDGIPSKQTQVPPSPEGQSANPRRFRGVDVNNPLLVAERNRLADHYRKVTRTATTTGGREEIGDLLHAGHDPAELVRAAEIYARHCDAQKLEPARRKGAKGFYGSQAWQEILASPPPTAAPAEEPRIGLSQLTPIRGPLEGPGFSKRPRKPLQPPEKTPHVAQDERGGPQTSQESDSAPDAITGHSGEKNGHTHNGGIDHAASRNLGGQSPAPGPSSAGCE